MWPTLVDLIASYAERNRSNINKTDKPNNSGNVAALTTAIGTCVGAGLAGIAAIVFYCQLSVMQQANMDANKSFIDGHKAFVFVSEFPTIRVYDGDKLVGTNITPVLRNGGETQSSGLTFLAYGFFDGNGFKQPCYNFPTKGLLGPNSNLPLQKCFVPLSDIESANAVEGKTNPYYLRPWRTMTFAHAIEAIAPTKNAKARDTAFQRERSAPI